MKKWTKKIIICVVFILLMGGATACSDDRGAALRAWRSGEASTSLTARFAATQAVTDDLYKNGFINKNIYDQLTKGNSDMREDVLADLKSDSMSMLIKSVVATRVISEEAANAGEPAGYEIQFDTAMGSEVKAFDGHNVFTIGQLAGMAGNDDWDGWVSAFGVINTYADILKHPFQAAEQANDYWKYLNYYIPGNLAAQRASIPCNFSTGDDHTGGKMDVWFYKPKAREGNRDEKFLSSVALNMVPQDETLDNTLKKALSFNVYVLDPDQKTGMDLDHVIDAIEKVTGGKEVYSIDTSNQTEYDSINEILGSYFVAACTGDLNSGVKPVTLIDTDKYPVLCNSRTSESSADAKTVGYNLVIGDKGYDQIQLQCYDYNPEFVDILYSIGADKGKFLLVHSKGENRAYLMEYPAYEIEGFIYDPDIPTYAPDIVGKEYRTSLKESKLSVNILTKELVKYNTNASGNKSESNFRSATEDTGRHMSNDIKQYLTVGGTYVDPTDNNKINTSSFIICGRARSNLSLEDVSINQTVHVMSGRVILRDYLELAYAPDCAAEGENLTAFGRKLRFNFDSSNVAAPKEENPEGYIMTERQQKTFEQTELLVGRDEQIISFVDFNGIPLKQNNASKEVKLTIKDLADAEALGREASKNTLNVIANRNEAEGDNVTTPTITSGGDRLKVTDLEKHSIQGTRYAGSTALSDLPVIEPTTMFPGPLVNKADFENETIDTQLMYGMAVRSTLVDTALYSGWITSQDPQASMIAWNDFLTENALTYQVDANEVNDYLMGSYVSELQEAGVIILDLNVIAKIERDMARDSTTMRNRWIQTSIYVLAWGLIIYAVLLLTAWTFDVNADFGFKLTEKLTLGNWVACADKSELPVRSSSTVQYVTLPRLLMSCFGIAALGVLLLSVSAFNLVYFLIDVFGAFAQKVETIIRGI